MICYRLVPLSRTVFEFHYVRSGLSWKTTTIDFVIQGANTGVSEGHVIESAERLFAEQRLRIAASDEVLRCQRHAAAREALQEL